jgi:hypothetical protein
VAVGAAGGWTAWSEVKSGHYALVTRSPQGVVSHPAVGTRGVPFDLDLGLGPGGAPLAAYSRCKTEPRDTPGELLPVWTTGKGCRLVVLDLVKQTERRLALSAGSKSDVLPAVAGSKVAFVRVPKASKDRHRAVLGVRDLAGGHARGLLTGPRSDVGASTRFGPVSVDTDGHSAVVVFANLDTSFNSYDHELKLVPLAGGKARSLDSGSNTEDCQSRVVAPTLSGGGRATWIDQGSAGYAVGQGSTAADARFAAGVSADATIVSGAVDATRLVLADSTGAISEQPLPAFGGKLPAIAGC